VIALARSSYSAWTTGGDGLVHFRLGPRGQHLPAGGGEPVEYLGDLLGRLAGTIDHLRKAATNRPVVVHGGEAERLERQLSQALDGLVDIDVAGADGFEQFSQCLLVHSISSIGLSWRGR